MNELTPTRDSWPQLTPTPTPGGGVSVHGQLSGRDAADQHPIGAVTGLQAALDALVASVGEKAAQAALDALTATVAGKASSTDPRFTDQRVPTDASVTLAKAAGDLIARLVPTGSQLGQVLGHSGWRFPVASRKIASASRGTAAIVGTPLAGCTSGSTSSMTPGQVYVFAGGARVGTAVDLAMRVSANAVASDVPVLIGAYALDADDLPTGTPLWTETLTIPASSTGIMRSGTISRSFTGLPIGIATLIPNSAAGGPTVEVFQNVQSGWPSAASLLNRTSLQSSSGSSGLNALPDVTGWTITNAGSGAGFWIAAQNTPAVYARS